jgi:prevent-host-death family protein
MEFLMTTVLINTIEAKEQFTDLINRVAHNKERVILTRRGKELVAIIALDDLKLLLTYEDKQDLDSAIEALAEARQKGTLSLEQLKETIRA